MAASGEQSLDAKVVRPHIKHEAREGDGDDDVVPSDAASVTAILVRSYSRKISQKEKSGRAAFAQAKSDRLAPAAEHPDDDEQNYSSAAEINAEQKEAAEDTEDTNEDEEPAPVRLGALWQNSLGGVSHGSQDGGGSGSVGGGGGGGGLGAFNSRVSVQSDEQCDDEPAEELVSTDVPWSSFAGLEYLGEGAMCRVFKGTFKESNTQVAVKLPLEDGPESGDNDLVIEMGILRHLRHPNIIRLVAGGTASNGQHYIALELLAETLSERMGKIAPPSKMTLATVLSCSQQLAKALEYMHDRAIEGYTIMHRDLKPDNIAFTADGTLKLFDFGLAKVIQRKYRSKSAAYHMTGETGSLRYMPPEVCRCEPYNEKADVYSFGVIMWQMLTNRVPYEGLGHAAFLNFVIDGGQRPHLTKDWSEDIKRLLTSTWDADMDARPSMREVVGIIRNIDKLGMAAKTKGKR